jgi:uroporphyrinogen III methyltransferase/synthase
LTLRGAAALAAADAVVYDYLANPALLAHAKPEAEQVYVGKRAGAHSRTQDEINALLVERAQTGQRIARLKGGDPFVFGRGGEEALALVKAGISFEVIPGVSSAIAAPAYAGIPITHRGLASSFAVITGHEDPTKDESAVNWQHLASGVDTLVFLMGVGHLAHIVDQLLEHGRAESTPVALIRWGTTPNQATVSGSLSDIVEKVRAARLKPPAVAVIGQVASLRDQLNWFEDRPLFGHRVLVTRTRAQASVLSARLRNLGADPVELPTIRIVAAESWAPLDTAIERLPEFDWIIFTSTNGVQFFWERLNHAGQDARALSGVMLAAIGPATAAALESHGVRPDYVPQEYVAEAIAAGLPDIRSQRVLLPRADIARRALADALREAGAEVEEVTTYRTLRPEAPPGDLRVLLQGITTATFTSSSTVRNLAAMAQDAGIDLPQALEGVLVVCIGPITAQTAREQGLDVGVMATEYTIDGLVKALVEHVSPKGAAA